MHDQDTGTLLRRLRLERGWTQRQAAELLGVSAQAVSKWERGQGCPDVGMLPRLAKIFGVSVEGILDGDLLPAAPDGGNMKKIQFYVCPICGNIITATGKGHFSCCGITLPELESESGDTDHQIIVETIDDEYSVTMQHFMNKAHYISFIAYVTSGSVEIIKLYPEQDISVRFRKKGHGILYVYCNRHGLFRKNI